MISVLDTTAFAAAMRSDPAMDRFLRSRRPGEVATVPPVVAEIEYGIQRLEPGTRKRVLLEAARTRVLGVLGILPWTPDVSVRFGAIKAALERAGDLIDDFDIAIAAIAASHGADVVSSDPARVGSVDQLSRASGTNWRRPVG